jgi:type II secretion system protein L
MLALGVDLVRDAIALALVETSGRAPRVVGSWREERDPGRPAAEQLRAMIDRHCTQRPDAVASALPGAAVSHRVLRLPFSDAARLAATVPFELESLVPFDVESGVIAFTAVQRDGAGATVLAAIAQRRDVQAHLELLAAAGVDPAVVDLGTLAVAGLLKPRTTDLLLVEPRDDGGVCLLRGGHPAALRIVDGAASDADGARELRWAALALLEDDEASPPLLLVAPADAGRALASAFGTEPLSLAAELPAWCAGAPVAHLRAIALAARASGATALGLDFRTGEFAYHAPSEEARRQLRIAGLLGAAVVLLALASFVAAITARRAELAQHRAEVARAVADVLPGAAPGTERTRLQGAIDGLEARRKVLGGGSDRPKTLDLMRSISEAVPEQVKVTVDDFAVDDDGVRLHAKTDSYESVDVVKRSLQNVPGLFNPEVKDVKAGVDGRIEFRIAFRFSPEARS